MADQTINITSGFYDSVSGDRLYSADQMNMPYKRVISEGVFSSAWGDKFDVQQTGEDLVLTVSTGGALYAGKWIDMSTAQEITVPENNTAYNRIDTLLLQVDTRLEGRKAALVYRTGTPDASPVHPAINQVVGVYELPLFDVDVDAGATALYLDDLHDRRTFARVVLDQDEFSAVDSRLDALEAYSAKTFKGNNVSFDYNYCAKVGKLAVFFVSGTASATTKIYFPAGFNVKEIPYHVVGIKGSAVGEFDVAYATPLDQTTSGNAFSVNSGYFSISGVAPLN